MSNTKMITYGLDSEELCFCTECGVEYLQRSLLRNHMMSSHGITMSSPSNKPVKNRETSMVQDYPAAKNVPMMDFEDYDENEEDFYDEEDEEEGFHDPDIMEVDIPSDNFAGFGEYEISRNIKREQMSVIPTLGDTSEEDDYSDEFSNSDYEEEEEPEEITLDGDDEDDDIIIEEDTKQTKEENNCRMYEKLLSETDKILEITEKPGMLERLEKEAWWSQPIKWKPSNSWEVWHARVQQVCAHYKLRDLEIRQETFMSYDEFDRFISPKLMEVNPGQSFKILYTWKKAKWFSLLDPIIPDHMKIVEETLEDDD